MRENDIFGDYMKLTVSTFKEDDEWVLVHMTCILHLSKPPFQRANKDTNEADTRKSNEDEVESTRKI